MSTLNLTPRRWKLLLTALLLIVGVSTGAAATWATFTAQTRNPSNVFGTGAIVLSDKVGSGTACLSTGGGNTDTNSNTGCDALYNVTARKPGDTATANVTIANVGDTDAGTFKVYSAACTGSDTASSYHGTASPCGQLQFYIERYSDASFTTATGCVYGTASGSSCTFDATHTLGAFQAAYGSAASGVTISGGLAASTSGYFKVGVLLPTTADNTIQGRQAVSDLTWFIQP
jgi:hypothetical protein